MELQNGEIRQREKSMRELKRKDTSMLKGYQLYHNCIRERSGVDNKTPAEMCGITVEGEK